MSRNSTIASVIGSICGLIAIASLIAGIVVSCAITGQQQTEQRADCVAAGGEYTFDTCDVR